MDDFIEVSVDLLSEKTFYPVKENSLSFQEGKRLAEAVIGDLETGLVVGVDLRGYVDVRGPYQFSLRTADRAFLMGMIFVFKARQREFVLVHDQIEPAALRMFGRQVLEIPDGLYRGMGGYRHPSDVKKDLQGPSGQLNTGLLAVTLMPEDWEGRHVDIIKLGMLQFGLEATLDERLASIFHAWVLKEGLENTRGWMWNWKGRNIVLKVHEEAVQEHDVFELEVFDRSA